MTTAGPVIIPGRGIIPGPGIIPGSGPFPLLVIKLDRVAKDRSRNEFEPGAGSPPEFWALARKSLNRLYSGLCI